MYKSAFIKAAIDRGFLNECNDLPALDALASEHAITCYVGFDCTSDSLHAGSLLPIMLLRLFQRSGHKPIVLMGGGTTKIGDPSGKDESRPLLDDAQIARNMEGIKNIFSRYLMFGDGPTDAIMVNNADWLDDLRYIWFLREFGKHFSVNRMLAFDSVKQRLERNQTLSFLEFNYMLLQSYDYLELSRRHGCVLQMGGSDQWGNILNGIEVIRRIDHKVVYGLTTSLLTTASGAKMGKTEHGAIWLNAERLSPYEYYQYWRNADDRDVGGFLRFFTELSINEIKRLEALEGADINEAKKVLAFEATKLCHGQDEADAAAETAKKTFEERDVGDALPTVEVAYHEFDMGIPIVDLLKRSGLVASKGEARRLIEQSGIYINDRTVTSTERTVTIADRRPDESIKLSVGKKRHLLVHVA